MLHLRIVGLTTLALSLALATSGCGSSNVPEGPTGTVMGKVTLNGEPGPAGCSVVFLHVEKGLPASGKIGADGTYALLMKQQSAIPVGLYKVSVAASQSEQLDPEAAMDAYMQGKKFEGPAIPDKYLRPETSGLMFEVKAGSNTFNIEMEGKG